MTLLTFIFNNCLSLVQQLLILKRVLVDAEEQNIVLLQSTKITRATIIGKNSNWEHYRLLPNLDHTEQNATIPVWRLGCVSTVLPLKIWDLGQPNILAPLPVSVLLHHWQE